MLDLLASAGSWLSHTRWLVPLGTVVAAFAAVLTAIIAAFIGWQARNVANAQKGIAGLAEITKMNDRLYTAEFLTPRHRIAVDYLVGTSVDPESAYDLLDFMEDLALYERNDYIAVDDLATLFSSKFICWWYVAEPVVGPFREKRCDPLIWTGVEELIGKLHESCRTNAPAWGQRPTDTIMRAVFDDELAVVVATRKRLEAAP